MHLPAYQPRLTTPAIPPIVAPALLPPTKSQPRQAVDHTANARLARGHLARRGGVAGRNVQAGVGGEEVARAEEAVGFWQSVLLAHIQRGGSRHRLWGMVSVTYTVMGSAGITGKSSGEGKCVRPKVCQSTTSWLSTLASGSAAIQAGRPWEGSPEVWGTWRPAGWSCSSLSVKERGC